MIKCSKDLSLTLWISLFIHAMLPLPIDAKEVQVTVATETANTPQQDQNVNQNYREAELDLSNLLDVLVPPSTIEVTDIFDNNYELSSSCSARAQIKILKELNGLKDLDVVQEAIGSGVVISDASDIVRLVTSVAGDDQIMSGIATAFEIAHPSAYAKAKKSAKENGVKYNDAADLFAVEELAGSVIPLFIRLVKRGAVAMQTLSRATMMSVDQQQTT